MGVLAIGLGVLFTGMLTGAAMVIRYGLIREERAFSLTERKAPSCAARACRRLLRLSVRNHRPPFRYAPRIPYVPEPIPGTPDPPPLDLS